MREQEQQYFDIWMITRVWVGRPKLWAGVLPLSQTPNHGVTSLLHITLFVSEICLFEAGICARSNFLCKIWVLLRVQN